MIVDGQLCAARAQLVELLIELEIIFLWTRTCMDCLAGNLDLNRQSRSTLTKLKCIWYSTV